VPCPRIQQANLPAYLHTIPLILNVMKETVNSNYWNLLVRLDERIEPRYNDYEAYALKGSFFHRNQAVSSTVCTKDKCFSHVMQQNQKRTVENIFIANVSRINLSHCQDRMPIAFMQNDFCCALIIVCCNKNIKRPCCKMQFKQLWLHRG